MPPFLQFVIRRFLVIPVSLVIITMMLYGGVMLTPPEARALGGGPFWIIRKHLLRNSIGPAIVLAARDMGGVVLLQATLTFIQIGGGSIWGEMLAQGRNWIIGPGGSVLRYWWVFLPPTIAVMLFGIVWNIIGDGLNDALEPTSQRGFGRRWFRNRKGKGTEAQPVARTGGLEYANQSCERAQESRQ